MMESPEEVPLVIPCLLKQRLEDDCFWIARRGKLIRLPAEANVTSILRDYYEHILQASSSDTDLALLAEVLDGLKIYFDFMLPDQLLYSQEKNQFKKLLEEKGIGRATTVNRIPHTQPVLPKASSNHVSSPSPGHSDLPPTLPSDIYGIEHLLRLFVRLPWFLCKAQLPLSHITMLHTHLKDLLEYLTNHSTTLFSETHYEETASYRSNGLNCENSIQALANDSLVNSNIEQ